ncbi:lipase family protein [Paraburkholderia bannensis]|uniref:lipase family protein n=1 Tax=Paraburkholderia bannensis TaxID=765414 RepID=UPI002AB6B5C5|nr:hypothetical protein [Paraburkholderia bannensis]
MDWTALLLAARRANAAYIEDQAASKAAFLSLGDDWISMYADASHQAVLSATPAGETHLSISGTRASEGKLADVWADARLDPVLCGGGTATAGVCERMQELWDWVLQTVPADITISVCGHSLGGARTHLTPAFLPCDRIGALHSFAAPKFIAADFYAAHHDALAGMVCVLNGRDGWASWPWFDKRWTARPPLEHIWLQDTGFDLVLGDLWPGGWAFADHDMDEYQARIAALKALEYSKC